MHDVTEGGVLGAIYEMAAASEKGVLVKNDQIPIGETQREICELFDFDSRYCIGAGSMIITCRKNTSAKVIKRLNQAGIPCTEVGEIKAPEYGMKIEKDRSEVHTSELMSR